MGIGSDLSVSVPGNSDFLHVYDINLVPRVIIVNATLKYLQVSINGH